MKQPFLLALLFTPLASAAQWELMTPIKTTSEYEDMVMVNELVGYLADRPSGTILATEDGGNKWVRRQHLLSNNPLALHMWDEQRGISVGQTGGVLRTTDGFRTVTSSSFGVQTNNCVFFINDTLGWIGRQDGRIYRSIDGGATWDQMQSGQSTSNYITAIQFVDTQVGYASCYGGGKVLKSIDGGLTWTSIAPEPLVFIRDLHFFDALTGVAVGGAGHVIRTTDGGATWDFMPSNTTYNLVSLAVQGNHLVACGWWGRTIRSSDGGLTWSEQFFGPDHTAVTLTPSGFGLMGSIGKIYRTTDFGSTWELFKEGHSSASINKISFAGMIGITGNALRTTDGGATWANSGAGGGLGVHLNADGTGCRGGGSGSFGRTSDFFATSSPGVGPSVAIRCTWSLGGGTHLVGGGAVYGGIYRTNNNGVSWSYVLNVGNITISDLWFVDELQGYAVGEYGDSYRTTDGGLTWSTMGGSGGHTVFFADAEYGWTKLGRTTDGGDTWTMMGGTPQSTMSIFFTGRDTGYAVAMSGHTVRSLDGGVTWANFLPELHNSGAYDAAYVDGRIIVAGSLGDIYRSPRIGCSSTPWVPDVLVDGQMLCTPIPGITQWYRNMVPIEGGTESCIDADTPGDYHVIVTDELGCTSAPSAIFTVECSVLPAAHVEQQGDELCTTSNGAPQWYWNDDPIAGASAPCIVPEAPGLYHVVVTDPNGCTSAPSETINVDCPLVPVPEVVVEDDGQLCTPEMWSIQWYINNEPIVGGGMPCIVPEAPGSYYVVVGTEHACMSDPSEPVEVDCPVIGGPDVFEVDGSLCTGSVGGYQWYLNGDPLENEVGDCVLPMVDGDYQVVVVNEHGCSSEPSQPVTITGVWIREADTRQAIHVWPNPAQDHLRIEGPALGNVALRITDMQGRTVALVPDLRAGGTVPVSGLAAGTYVLYLQATEITHTVRFVKE